MWQQAGGLGALSCAARRLERFARDGFLLSLRGRAGTRLKGSVSFPGGNYDKVLRPTRGSIALW